MNEQATKRLTMAQAIIAFLKNQYVERDGREQPFFAGCFGIFGHGNIAGIGQALQQMPEFRYYQARNEQAMVHSAAAYAKTKNRLQTFACTSSVGPGATNMVTGAALATINRLPVLLLPGDIFARRNVAPVLQQLESEHTQDISVNDCFKPVSRYWDRIMRPEQLLTALPEAMRVLTSPAETGAVTLALPEDVQTEAYAYPDAFFRKRIWHIPRNRPDRHSLEQAAAWIRASKQPLLVIGIGTRYSDFTTSSKTAFQNPEVHFININVAPLDAYKQFALPLAGDAKVTLEELLTLLDGYSVDPNYRTNAEQLHTAWEEEVERIYTIRNTPLPSQGELIGAVNELSDPSAIMVCAAGSLPGDLHKLWRARHPKNYHMEYGYSCMGYEIAGGLGIKMAAPDHDVYVMVGDGSYLMMNSEIVTSIQEHYKLIIVLLDNSGFKSIGALSRSLGQDGFGTRYVYPHNGRWPTDAAGADVQTLPVDLAANARSLGAHVIECKTYADFVAALNTVQTTDRTSVIYIQNDRYVAIPNYEGWWDVPVAEVSEMSSVQAARAEWAAMRAVERYFLEQ